MLQPSTINEKLASFKIHASKQFFPVKTVEMLSHHFWHLKERVEVWSQPNFLFSCGKTEFFLTGYLHNFEWRILIIRIFLNGQNVCVCCLQYHKLFPSLNLAGFSDSHRFPQYIFSFYILYHLFLSSIISILLVLFFTFSKSNSSCFYLLVSPPAL